MKKKIIYVDFIKRRRITFAHYIINKILSLLSKRFTLKNKNSNNMEVNNNKCISNKGTWIKITIQKLTWNDLDCRDVPYCREVPHCCIAALFISDKFRIVA